MDNDRLARFESEHVRDLGCAIAKFERGIYDIAEFERGSEDRENLKRLGQSISRDEIFVAYIICTWRKSKSMNSLLDLALKHDNVEIVKDMLMYNACAVRECGMKSLLDEQNTYRRLTPIFMANSTDALRVLINAGADVNVCDHRGNSVLLFYSLYSLYDECELIDILLDAGARMRLGAHDPLISAIIDDAVERTRVFLNRRGFLRLFSDDLIDLIHSRDTRCCRMTRDAYGPAEMWDRRLDGTRIGLVAADARTGRLSL